MGTTVVKGNYEFWLAVSNYFHGSQRDHVRKICKISGGDLAHKVLMLPNGGDILKLVYLFTEYFFCYQWEFDSREVAAEFNVLLQRSSALFYGIGLTDNLILDVYQDDDQVMLH